jgi:HAD domain in Swiss Army Knife RNA repair proteins
MKAAPNSNNNNNIIVIFLDIDGVLLPFPDPSHVENGRIFPNKTLAALSTILEAFDDQNRDDQYNNYRVGIVLSSTWRVQASMRNEILNDFAAYGCYGSPLAQLDEFYDITDPAMHTERQHEIYAWLTDRTKNTRIAAWIALDDEELLEGPANALRRSYFEGHVIHCDSKVGLTQAQADDAIQLIRNQLQLRIANTKTHSKFGVSC